MEAHTTADEQIALLTCRGLICRNEALYRRWPITVGYHRLSAYSLPYEIVKGQTCSKRFTPGAEFKSIVSIYTLGWQRRLLVLGVIERSKIAQRFGKLTTRQASRQPGCWQMSFPGISGKT